MLVRVTARCQEFVEEFASRRRRPHPCGLLMQRAVTTIKYPPFSTHTHTLRPIFCGYGVPKEVVQGSTQTHTHPARLRERLWFVPQRRSPPTAHCPGHAFRWVSLHRMHTTWDRCDAYTPNTKQGREASGICHSLTCTKYVITRVQLYEKLFEYKSRNHSLLHVLIGLLH